jgi:serine/threonine protein kinase
MLIGGRYDIIRALGRGGFGKTFLATDTYRRGTPKCVVKKFQAQSTVPSLIEKVRGVFEYEAQALYALNDCNQVPRLLDHLEQNGEFYIVQELIDGNDLRQAFALGSRWEEKKLVEFLHEVLDVLDIVHQQDMIHQDVAPHNFIRRWSDKRLVLLGFGGIKSIRNLMLSPDGELYTTRAIGTAGYMPKEQAEGAATFSSDLYALGMLGIQAMTGYLPNQLPRHSSTLEVDWYDQAPLVSAELRQILDKMVRYDVNQRYQSVTELRADLPDPPPRSELAVIQPKAVEIDLDSLVAPPPPKPPKPRSWSLAIAPQFDYSRDFSEGLAAVVQDGKLGYIDTTGKFVIAPQFEFDLISILRDGAYQFSEGMARIAIAHEWGYIDKDGDFLIQPQYEGAENFSKGLARVELDQRYGYIDNTGIFVVKPIYDSAAPYFSESLANVEIERKHGYINTAGTLVIDPQFDSADHFSEGLARITMDHKYGFIDKTGAIVIPAEFDVAHTFQQGLARVRIDERYGYIKPNGELAIPAKFDDTFSFTEGIALVRNDDKYGFINRTGKVMIPLQFEDAYPFSEGLAAVKQNQRWGYVNVRGEIVITCQYEDARSFRQGLAAVQQDGKWGYLREDR